MTLCRLLVSSMWGFALVTATPSLATDGYLVDPGGTYYEEQLESGYQATSEPTLPDRLSISSSEARLAYRVLEASSDSVRWEVSISGFERRHERVEALYDMILILPLPAHADGEDAFSPVDRGVAVWEGPEDSAVPLVYGGAKIVLKRNIALEKALLPQIVGTGGEPDLLPPIDGTGYRYTAWDTVVSLDPSHTSSVQASASLRYATHPAAPSPTGLAAWWITWIPALPADVAPYAVRIDLTSED